MADGDGRRSVDEAREKADRLARLVEGWVNAEAAQREYRDRAEARVTALEAASRIDGARISALEAALRDMCNTAESHAVGKSDRAQVRHVVDQCRALLDDGSERVVEKP